MSAVHDLPGGSTAEPLHLPTPSRRRRSIVPGIIRRVVALAILVGIAAGTWWIVRTYVFASDDAGEQRLTHKVARGDLVITVTEDGNVESASNIDIRCQ